MVSFAIILAEDDACGAAGFGAVMGSKKLKAIAVQGTKGPRPADPAKLKTLSTFLREIKKNQPFQIPSLPEGAKVNKQITFREGFGSILAEGPIRAARKLGSSAEDLPGDHIARDGSFAYYLPRPSPALRWTLPTPVPSTSW